MAVPAAPTIASVVDELEVAAARLTVTVPANTEELFVWRVGASGVVAGVRGWYSGDVTSPTSQIVRDFESPLGIALTYFAQGGNVDGLSPVSAGVVHTQPSTPTDNPQLVDLVRPTNTRSIVLEEMPQMEYPIETGVHRVLQRHTPVVTSDVAGTPNFDLAFYTLVFPDERDACREILGNGLPVLLRTPPEQGVGNLFFQVLAFSVERPSRVAFHEERRFLVQGVQIERPDPTLYTPQPPATYAGVEATYATYAELLTARGTYDGMLYDYGTGETAPTIPWIPADV